MTKPVSASSIEAAKYLLMLTHGDVLKAKDFWTSAPPNAFTTSGLDFEGALWLLPIVSNHLTLSGSHFYRSILTELVSELAPGWAQYAHLGAAHVIERLTTDERQLFRYAELDFPNHESIIWWDSIASLSRKSQNDILLDYGRLAERWCFEYEQAVSEFPKEVRWVSFDTNLAGYDIFSNRKNRNDVVEDVYIEVKYVGSKSEFFLSRHEWDVALQLGESWELRAFRSDSDFTPYKASDLSSSIPIDCGYGSWITVKISI